MNISHSVASTLLEAQNFASASDTIKSFRQFITASNGSYSDNEVALYVVSYYRFQYLKSIFSTIRGITRLILSCFGLIGYGLECFTLRHKDFQTVSFIYHKAIVFFASITCISVLMKGLTDIIPVVQQSFAFFVASSYVFDMLYNIAAFTADFIILFMTFERCVAVIFPTKFHRVNRSVVAWTNVVISTLLGLSYIVDKIGPTLNYSMTVGPSVAFSSRTDPAYITFATVRDAINLWKGILIGIFSVAVVVGIKKLKRDENGPHWKKQQLITRQLCILSLTCGCPITLASIALLVKNYYGDSYIAGTAAFKLPFNQALELCDRGVFYVVEQYVYEFLKLVAHCLHFYLYFALSQSFRSATVDMLLGKSSFKFGGKSTRVADSKANNSVKNS